MIVGIDEAGRGALAGPVVAGAVCFLTSLNTQNCPVFNLIKDSKKLTSGQRRTAYEWLVKNVGWGDGVVSAKIIDDIGIKLATELAMNQALKNLRSTSKKAKSAPKILVDGRDKFKFPFPSKDIVKGDEKVLEISAASIMAKVIRDDYMVGLDKKFPEFGFAGHKGYGAAAHYKLLDEGVYCEEHRQSYDPLRTWLNQGRLF